MKFCSGLEIIIDNKCMQKVATCRKKLHKIFQLMNIKKYCNILLKSDFYTNAPVAQKDRATVS
ncbi:hypothetical protein KsCSTR_37320 [Candidatus Kuenenia stuttgartiensis]|uniref:Uncharacterized protein n=1 Tax=Kuenenia stuttgartiensis TaxID=174633 RepID=A0A6G7GUH9_KUEST|nr:hypothetical protein KsCSTR_37320 [Candidatus Kuenenia stuttgartiensis]